MQAAARASFSAMVADGMAEGSCLLILARMGASVVATASRGSGGGGGKGWPLRREKGGPEFYSARPGSGIFKRFGRSFWVDEDKFSYTNDLRVRPGPVIRLLSSTKNYRDRLEML